MIDNYKFEYDSVPIVIFPVGRLSKELTDMEWDKSSSSANKEVSCVNVTGDIIDDVDDDDIDKFSSFSNNCILMSSCLRNSSPKYCT